MIIQQVRSLAPISIHWYLVCSTIMNEKGAHNNPAGTSPGHVQPQEVPREGETPEEALQRRIEEGNIGKGKTLRRWKDTEEKVRDITHAIGFHWEHPFTIEAIRSKPIRPDAIYGTINKVSWSILLRSSSYIHSIDTAAVAVAISCKFSVTCRQLVCVERFCSNKSVHHFPVVIRTSTNCCKVLFLRGGIF